MKRILSRIGLGLLAVVGLYFTVLLGVVAAGVIMGYASTYKSPPVTIHYVTKTAPAPSAR